MYSHSKDCVNSVVFLPMSTMPRLILMFLISSGIESYSFSDSDYYKYGMCITFSTPLEAQKLVSFLNKNF
jgi:hypothetical protein